MEDNSNRKGSGGAFTECNAAKLELRIARIYTLEAELSATQRLINLQFKIIISWFFIQRNKIIVSP